MILAAASAGPSAYWYLARGTGVVAQLLLTVAVVLGVLNVQRYAARRWPRFVIDRLHRDVSLLVLAVLAVHIATSVLDAFAPIGLLDAVVPLSSAYRPLWLGLGALAFDLLLAVAITSLVRRRLGYQAWRAVHWLAYVSWPVAILHGLGTGSDTKQGWMLILTGLCVVAVLAAVVVRVLDAQPDWPALRPLSLAAAVLTPLGLIAFVLLGPLAPHWARRAGTPASLLAPARAASPSSAVRVARVRTTPSRRDAIAIPFSARLSGRVRQIAEPGGALIDLVLRCSGGIAGELRVRMAGAPMPGGGLSMTGSQVQLTAVGLRSVLEGKIESLQGEHFQARVSNVSGTALVLLARLTIDNRNDTVTGTLTGLGA
jgi:hypothetical protein